jgi:hypothetical protein
MRFKILSSLIIIIFFFTLVNATPKKPIKVLIFTKTHNAYRHESIEKSVISLTNLLNKKGIIANTTEDSNTFNTENLKQYNAVIFMNTGGDVFNDDQKKAFIGYIMAAAFLVCTQHLII